MRVFVTGATGFVGPAVANAIVDAGHDVHVLERTPGSSATAGIKKHTAVQGDVTNLDSLRRAVRDIDVVV
ncbi:MAG TPA: NAD-dependent epimerase/dehydratase family protein, partial [Marmoricola sp.]|nr:NAD-dependent epimerase/dehydratase family protein [Marmoricola sp.]